MFLKQSPQKGLDHVPQAAINSIGTWSWFLKQLSSQKGIDHCSSNSYQLNRALIIVPQTAIKSIGPWSLFLKQLSSQKGLDHLPYPSCQSEKKTLTTLHSVDNPRTGHSFPKLLSTQKAWTLFPQPLSSQKGNHISFSNSCHMTRQVISISQSVVHLIWPWCCISFSGSC